MNITPIAFIDPTAFGATLALKYHRHFADDTRRQDAPGSPHHDTMSIALRGPENPDGVNWFQDVPQVDYPLLEEWAAARDILARIEARLQANFVGQNMMVGKVLVTSLKPGGWIDWHVDQGPYAEVHSRFHLPVLPSWGAALYSGGDVATPNIGVLNFFNNRVPHSAANMGPVPRVHLIVDVRQPTKQ